MPTFVVKILSRTAVRNARPMMAWMTVTLAGFSFNCA
jgi:hypothetical protein